MASFADIAQEFEVAMDPFTQRSAVKLESHLQRVILIHGINTDGAWQEQVRDVLEPHFDCVLFKYSEYRKLGVVKAPLAKWLRRPVVRRYLGTYEDAYRPGERPPHVIAHSFGTVLTGEIVQRAHVRFSKILLTGAALPRRFPWSNLLKSDPNKFRDLRNETGGRDWVATVARIGGLVSRKLGDAGRMGFIGPGVHDIAGPLEACMQCDAAPGRVHNVPLGEYGHSDHFLSKRHARELWLPYFWGIAPARYLELLELCRQWLHHCDEGELAQADEYLEKIAGWLMPRELSGMNDPMTIGEYIFRQLAARKKHGAIHHPDHELREAAPFIVAGVARAIVAATSEQDLPPNERSRPKLQALHPRKAVLRALDAFFKIVEDDL